MLYIYAIYKKNTHTHILPFFTCVYIFYIASFYTPPYLDPPQILIEIIKEKVVHS